MLLIGSDADRLDAASNGAAPAGTANGDTLLLLRADPAGPLQVLSHAHRTGGAGCPADRRAARSGSLYRQGGPALRAGAVAELVGLDPGQPERYVVLPRSGLRELVDGLGGLEVNLDQAMRYHDRAQTTAIDLQGGLQRAQGRPGGAAGALPRARTRGEAGRRRQQEVVGGCW